jgi:hypothetical protein
LSILGKAVILAFSWKIKAQTRPDLDVYLYIYTSIF